MTDPTFARALLRWYDRERRDLPWRRAPSAYATLVSELMLQQTVMAAIVLGQRTFALDGNAARVVARLYAEDRPIDVPAVRVRLRSRGQTLVPAHRAGDFAQGVMELGALVCTPTSPRCPECPVA